MAGDWRIWPENFPGVGIWLKIKLLGRGFYLQAQSYI